MLIFEVLIRINREWRLQRTEHEDFGIVAVQGAGSSAVPWFHPTRIHKPVVWKQSGLWKGKADACSLWVQEAQLL